MGGNGSYREEMRISSRKWELVRDRGNYLVMGTIITYFVNNKLNWSLEVIGTFKREVLPYGTNCHLQLDPQSHGTHLRNHTNVYTRKWSIDIILTIYYV